MDVQVLLSSCKDGEKIKKDGFNYRVLDTVKPENGGPIQTILHRIDGAVLPHTWAFIPLPSSTMVTVSLELPDTAKPSSSESEADDSKYDRRIIPPP